MAMSLIQLNQSQIADLQDLQNRGQWADAYTYLGDVVRNEQAIAGTEDQALEYQRLENWLNRAASINADDGSFSSEFVRGATEAIGDLLGKKITEDDFQAASDNLANSVINDVINQGAIPSSKDIIDSDVRSAVENLGLPQWGWAGTIGDILPPPFGLGGNYVDLPTDDWRKSGQDWAFAFAANTAGVGRWIVDKLQDVFKSLDSINTYRIVYYSDPLILDLDGDGIETTAPNGYNGPLFDNNADGISTATGWVKSDDGFLVRDLNGNGIIDSGTEQFGDSTVLADGTLAADGFAALSSIDSNHDGVVDAQDDAFGELRVWRDLNQDGASDAGELFTLDQVGISSLNAASTSTANTALDGGMQTGTGGFTRTDGSTGTMADVNLTVDTFHSRYTTQIDIPPELQSLPNIMGMGRLRDLQQAAALSPDLAATLADYSAAGTRTEQKALLDKLLLEWTKTDPLYTATPIHLHSIAGGTESSSSTNVIYVHVGDTFQFSGGDTTDLDQQTSEMIRMVDAFRGVGTTTDLWGGSETLQNYANSYSAMADAIYQTLLPQTRLKNYLDAITLAVDDAGIRFDYSAVEQLLDNRYATNQDAAFGDLLDMVKLSGIDSTEATWPGAFDKLRSWVEASGYTSGDVSGIQSYLEVLGLQAYSGDITGTAQNDSIFTINGAATVNAGAGNDIVIAGNSSDTLFGEDGDDAIYAYAGDDVITDTHGSDTIDGGAGDDSITDTGYGDTNVLNGGDGNDTINFCSSSNNTIDGGAGDDIIRADYNTSNNSLYYTNTFSGGTGNDRMESYTGVDVYLFNRGDGQDTIRDDDWYHSTRQDRLVLGEGIPANDVSVSRSGNDLVLTIANPDDPAATDRVTIENWVDSAYRIERIEFADGTLWTEPELTTQFRTISGTDGDDVMNLPADALSAYGNGGNDTITSGAGNRTIDGGAGNDVITDTGYGDTNVLNGGDGNDTINFCSSSNNTIDGGAGDDIIRADYNTSNNSLYYTNTFSGGTGNDRMESYTGVDVYLFNRGDGQDTIRDDDWYHSTRQDRLVLGTGIAADDVSVSRSGNDLVLTIANPDDPAATDRVTIENWLDSAYRIERIEFADGTLWTEPELTTQFRTISGTDGDDVMNLPADALSAYGKGGNDTINSGTSNITIYGGDGNDVITDTKGRNIIDGGAGNDSINGKGGDDTINGGAGDDAIFGSYGNDTIDGGADNDVINDYYGSDTIDGGAGDDTITDQGSGINMLRGDDGNDTITFSVGADNTVDGGTGNDLIQGAISDYIGVGHTNVITGGAGNDRLISGSSTDTYIFNRGDGQDTINDRGFSYSGQAGSDKLLFGPGISTSDLSAKRSGNNLVLTISDPNDPAATDQITIENWNNGIYRIEQAVFADGTAWTAADLTNQSSMGTNGAETLTAWDDATLIDGKSGDDIINSSYSNATVYGGDGNDAITDSNGSDTIDGGADNDTITDQGTGTNILRGGDGNDTITFSYQANNTIDGGMGDDLIQADNTNYASASNVTVITSGGGNDTINSGANNSTVYGDDGNDIITDTDGSDTIDGGAGDDSITDKGYGDTNVLNGGDGNDTINFCSSSNNTIDGGAGDDIIRADPNTNNNSPSYTNTLAGGTGNDRLESYAGVDVYLFNRGYGQDTIRDDDWAHSTRQDRLVLGGGITANDVSVSRSGNDLVLTIADPGNPAAADQVTIENWLDSAYRIERVEFADGTLWTEPQLTTQFQTISGTDGDDVMNLTADAISAYGKGGNDTINSGAGSRAIDGGTGDDVIIDTGYGDTNVLSGGDGNDTITFCGSSNNTANGGAGDDIIRADCNTSNNSSGYTNTFSGGTGNDRMESYSSADIYLFSRGDGQDTIQDYDWLHSALQDRLVLGTGITADDINVSRSGNDLVLAIANPDDPAATDRVTIENWTASDHRIERVEFADGTLWTEPQLTMLAMTGTDTADTLTAWYTGNGIINGKGGNDLVNGSNSNDLLIGGTGNDTVSTGSGADIIAFNKGDGQDTVNASTGKDNTLSLGNGIQYADLSFAKTGNDLVLVTGSNEQVTFKDWYASTDSHSVANLQMVIEGTADYDPASTNALDNKKVVQFNFDGLANQFDQARAATPGLTSWSLSSALLDFYLSSSDTAAIGGDLAYQYAKNGDLSSISVNPAQALLNSPQFGTASQGLQPLGALQDSSPRLS